ncbi:MAG: GNAT family N-acetyltransferase [Deltaproteobacteria bacterium]|nr:GNAT family N-acetyltransferase [Deltaproteobacteria bacterium]
MEYFHEQNFKLPTSQQMSIRQLGNLNDLERYHQFVCSLPSFRQNYLPHDSTDLERCRQQLNRFNGEESWALMAEMDGGIVATGTIERQPFEWTRHVAELRCTVAPTYNHLGIGRIMIHQLVELATSLGIERLFAEVVREHRGAQSKLRLEGFASEAVRPKYVRAIDGSLHDVVIMSKELQDVWGQFEDMLYEMDCRFSSGL